MKWKPWWPRWKRCWWFKSWVGGCSSKTLKPRVVEKVMNGDWNLMKQMEQVMSWTSGSQVIETSSWTHVGCGPRPNLERVGLLNLPLGWAKIFPVSNGFLGAIPLKRILEVRKQEIFLQLWKFLPGQLG